MESKRDQPAFQFKPLRWADAWAIGGWRYAAPYDVYDMERAPLLAWVLLRQLNEMLGYEVYSVWDDAGGLVGTFMFTRAIQGGITLGLAMRPDLTGKGIGPEFVRAGVAFARERFAPQYLRLDVAEFNQRAIKVYERAGFQPGARTFQWHKRGKKLWHREMKREP